MKILEIISDLNTGGAETLLKELCLGLKDRNFNVTVVVFSNKGKLFNEYLACGIEVIDLNVRYANSLIKILKTIKIILKLKPDVVHTHLNVSDRYGILAAFLCRINKRIMTAHNMEPNRKKQDPITRKIVSLFSTNIIAVSDCAKAMYITNNIYSSQKLRTIYNSPGFTIQEDIQPKVINSEVIQLINVGKLSVQKGHINLLTAMKLLEDRGLKVHLKIFGSKEAFKEHAKKVLSFIKDEKITNAEYCGVTNNLLSELKQSDIFVSTSLWEGMPLAPLEAMAAGLPCVLSSIEPHLEIVNVEDYQKYTVSSEDPVKISEMIEHVINNKSVYAKLSRLGIERAKKYSVKNMIDGYVDLFTQNED